MGVCVFCRENRFINNQKNGFSVDDSLIYDDNYTYITPDISPLVPGHLLVVSQEHYNSFSSAPMFVKESLFQSLRFIHDKMGYDKMMWFEHGAVIHGKGGASIDHAHVHVFPTFLPIQEEVEKECLFTENRAFSIELFNSLAKNEQPYLWISNENYSSSIYFVNDLPSQYLRSIAMRIQGNISYDWKSNYLSDASIKRYRATLDMARAQLNKKQ